MDLDLLSDMLGLTHVRGGVFGRLNAGAQWATPLTSDDPIKFCAATHGQSWYLAEGMGKPHPFCAGDVLVLNSLAPLRMGNDPVRLANASDACPEPDPHGTFQYGRGLDFSMLSGGIRIDADRLPLLTRSLPPVIHVTGDVAEAAPLSWLVGQLANELTPKAQMGRSTTLSALTQLLLVHALRAHLASGLTDGWLRVFADPRLTTALAAMHQDPAHPWRLHDLARLAGMSRTAFATGFRAVMGEAPMTYLARYRMARATRDLAVGKAVAAVAVKSGYASEPAFRQAYMRMTGTTPGAVRRQVRGRI